MANDSSSDARSAPPQLGLTMIPLASRRALPALARAFHGSPRAMQAAGALAPLSLQGLDVTRTQNPKPLQPLKDLVFGKTFTDHMMSVEWTATEGWHPPRIHPYSKIALDPSAIVFHYGLACFEGMKAYKDKAGKIRLFRPEMNAARLRKSADRLALPTFDTEIFMELLKRLLKVDEKWIPSERGYSVYIRPAVIGTQVRRPWSGEKSVSRSYRATVCGNSGIPRRERLEPRITFYYLLACGPVLQVGLCCRGTSGYE